jgi:hypothetical protein
MGRSGFLKKSGEFLDQVEDGLSFAFLGGGVKLQLLHFGGMIAGGERLSVRGGQGPGRFGNQFAVEIGGWAISGDDRGRQSPKNQIVQGVVGQMLFLDRGIAGSK